MNILLKEWPHEGPNKSNMDTNKTLEQIEALRKQLNRLEELAIEQEAKKRLETLKKEPVIRIYTTIIRVYNRPRLPYYPDARPYRTVPWFSSDFF